MANIYYPLYIQIVERKVDGWFQPQKEICLNPNKRDIEPLNAEKLYGLSKTEIMTQLFRKYQGKLGYYLVHLPKREYYYCGLTKENIQEKLWDLGIGRRDPLEETHG